MIKDKYNYKLNDNDKRDIALSYFLDRSNENVKAICDKYGISRRYIYDLIKKDDVKTLVKQSITGDKSMFTKRIEKIINTALEKIEYKLETDTMDKTTYKDIAVMIGTLYDKARLEQNLSTTNNEVHINIKVEK